MTRLGADRTDALKAALGGARVGLATNPTGLDSRLRPTADVLNSLARVVRLFGPEHGVSGEAQAGIKVGDSTDPRTGLPVVSLYGDRRKPAPEVLQDLDALVYDIQDVGLRWYTYPWTLSYLMEACEETGTRLVVLDRPNPLGGVIEGFLPEEALRSFVGRYPVPARYGLTIGELARHLARTVFPKVRLEVVGLEGWSGAPPWDETGLPWVAPSPNLPSTSSVTAYAALALLEGTNLSEGRGTTQPFEVFGAPWLDHQVLAERLNALDLPGLRWRPLWFRPTFSKFAGELCRGIQLHRLGTTPCQPWEAGLHVLALIQDRHQELSVLPPWKEGTAPPLALLSGTAETLGPFDPRKLIERGRREAVLWAQNTAADRLYPREAPHG